MKAKTTTSKKNDTTTSRTQINIDDYIEQIRTYALANFEKYPGRVYQKLEKGISEIASVLTGEAEFINIINAGRMNHGKSSLLNSLMDSDIFKVNDVRETVENRRELFKKNIYFTDTPGLEASDTDDKEAYSVYSRANFIFYVHTLRIGELHREEIANLQRIRNLFSEKYFRDHLAIVLTFAESCEPDEISSIKSKIEKSLLNELGLDSIKIFLVSNSRYRNGIRETNEMKRTALIKNSGIVELRDFILNNSTVWQSENLELKSAQFEDYQKKLTAIAESLKKSIDNQKIVIEKILKGVGEASARIHKRNKELALAVKKLETAKKSLAEINVY